METLKNKIDFTLIFEVKNANPNGDPLSENRPRVNYEDLGEVSDVCLKRKIRNRLQQLGEKIFVQSNDSVDDCMTCLSQRFENMINGLKLKGNKKKSAEEQLNEYETIKNKACEEWIDIRAFGQVFAYKRESVKDYSMGIRGAVSIQPAYSIDPLEIESIQIVKSVNGDEAGTKGRDTMGSKYSVPYALYRTNGSINTHFAGKNFFTKDDAEKIKLALSTLFENDFSAARPEGSMRIVKLIWWEHNCLNGNLPSNKIYETVKVNKNEKIDKPTKISDYTIEIYKDCVVKPQIIIDD